VIKLDSRHKLKRKKGSGREALLTGIDRIHLNSVIINPKILNKLYHKLNMRTNALLEDLDLILNSKHLSVWRTRYNDKLIEVMELVSQVGISFKPMYTYTVRRYSKRYGEKKRYVYWLDLTNESKLMDERIFEPSFALRKLRSNIGKTTTEKLIKAVTAGKIPTKKERTISESELESYAGVKEIISDELLKPEFRNKFQAPWDDIKSDIINAKEKLKKYNLDIVCQLTGNISID